MTEGQGNSTVEISVAQNTEANLRRYLAADHFYGVAKGLHFGGISLTVFLALASPLFLLYWPDLGPALGACASAWLFVSRLFLESFKQQLQLKGALAQELFDCNVFGLAWNEFLANPLSEEEIHNASGRMKRVDRVRNWYPTDNQIDWPRSILQCQRANAIWALRQHRSYGYVLQSAAAAWAIFGIVFAAGGGATLTAYLVTIALPSLPAVLDAAEFARAHLNAAEKRRLISEKTDELLAGRGADALDLREIQDQLFSLRREAPLVPGWFYKIVRGKFEEDMRYAAKRSAERAPGRDEGAH